MNENELENVMFSFLEGEFDVLVSTTIIETGVDIPNVNTLIVYDADRMGLSQLYKFGDEWGDLIELLTLISHIKRIKF